jgi:hypothetical protein
MTFGLKGKPDFSEQPHMLFLKFRRPQFRSNALQAHRHRGTSILHYDFRMPLESIPNFTEPAAKLWKAIPADIKMLLLANVWCGQCSDATIITNFTGVVRKGDLLLVGKCAQCHGDVAHVIESS